MQILPSIHLSTSLLLLITMRWQPQPGAPKTTAANIYNAQYSYRNISDHTPEPKTSAEYVKKSGESDVVIRAEARARETLSRLGNCCLNPHTATF